MDGYNRPTIQSGRITRGSKITLPEAVEILKTHNEWRRGAEIDMLEPRLIGIAIDVILEQLKERERNNDNTNKT